jgi:hypothetical protein
MPALSMGQVAGYAAGAGLSGEALAIATAISWAESKGDSDAVGDTRLVTSTWGPSIGLWQIRSLNAQRGTGGQRDELANKDPGTNARHMAEISNNGRSWGAWSTYTSGQYRAYLGQARMAAQNPSAVGSGPAASNVSTSDAALGFITDGGTWSRVGLFLFGGVLILVVLYRVSGVNAVDVVKTGIKAAV